ncbi:MAG: hypothetical protein DMG21_07365 [Acidobacteria bacterium]|nr:MAG: hypothetical protein DMG21_07365 [Acidobacteriota bacterium]
MCRGGIGDLTGTERGRLTDAATAEKILDTRFTTGFLGGQRERRVAKIAALDTKHLAKKA